MTGSIKSYTPNFNLIIPEFNISGWHDYLEENFRSIDALFYNLFGINNYSGVWEKLTSYTAGQVVFIGEDEDYSGRLVKVLVDHTTTNDDFTTFFANNPTYYELFADASTAQFYAQEARDWAVKLDGPVEDDLYSSKFYANIVNGLSTEITTLYNIRSDIQNVSLIGTEVVNVSNIKNSVQSVANNTTNINTVANNSSNINTVAGNSANINSVAGNSTNINSVANNITNIDTVASNTTNINTTATNIANVNTNATNISAINTNASNISAIQSAYSNAQSALNSKNLAQEWAISENIVDNIDYSAKHYANQSQTSAELSAQYANDKINQTHITNCITEIAQDIKLELNNGTLTLKAGSKVYVPNGAGVFDVMNITTDTILTQSWGISQTFLLFVRINGSLGIYDTARCYSGTSSVSDGVYYNTKDNKVYIYDGGSLSYQASLPIAIITGQSPTITSIKQVFNGFGYIGSTAFVLPGVKGLAPNGRNDDGSLKNTEYVVNSVIINTLFNNQQNVLCIGGNVSQSSYYVKQEEEPSTNYTLWYKPSENIMYRKSGAGVVSVNGGFVYAFTKTDNAGIAFFTPKTVFHSVDYDDVVLKQDLATVHCVVETYQNGTEWYRLYSDGWIEQGGFINSMTNNTNYTLNILKPFKDTNYNVQCVSSAKQHFMCPVSKTESTITFHTADVSYNTNTGCYWFSCGY